MHAEQNMGNYNLKTSSNYIVPESEQVNAEKKRRQFVHLRNSIQVLKEDFNAVVLSQRDRKIKLLEEIKDKNRTLRAINHELEQLGVVNLENITELVMDSTAFPELRFVITEKDIQLFKESEASNAVQDAFSLVNQVSKKKTGSPDNIKDNKEDIPHFENSGSPFFEGFIQHPRTDVNNGVKYVEGKKIELSEMEKKEIKMRIIVLNCRKSKIIKV